jgi:glucose-fructose oxidoreductase
MVKNGGITKQQTPARRKFIKQVIWGATALSLPRLNVLGRPAKDRLGVALVGLGRYSTELLTPALQRTKYWEPLKIPHLKVKYSIPL